ncbi:MAG: metallophosphoesterase [Candidatus Binataceae bacterium]
MATAELISETPATGDPMVSARASGRERPPLALRPLHSMWRRTIDMVELTRVNLPVRALPDALSGVVACQISDLHVDRDEDVERLGRAVALINREQPEFVFLTGDYFSGPDTMRRYLAAFRDAISKLAPRSGLFAIGGNHDHWAGYAHIADALRGAGAQVLANESRKLELRGERLIVVGIDDLWSRRAEPVRAFRDVRAGDPTIVLAHNPDTALYARHLKPGVMLCGHTHGGVVRIPFYGSPLRSILRIGKQYYSGLNRYEDFYIYTNRGLGTFWFRIRFNCRPEVSRFKLLPLADLPHQGNAPRIAHGTAGGSDPHHVETTPRRRRRRS